MSVFALKLALAGGLKAILTSSSDQKSEQMRQKFSSPPIQTVNHRTIPEWHNEILKLTQRIGADIVVENGGSSSLVQSLLCTRRGGIVSQVGYPGKHNPADLAELVPIIVDRRIISR